MPDVWKTAVSKAKSYEYTINALYLFAIGHTGGSTHYKSLPVSLQVVKSHPKLHR